MKRRLLVIMIGTFAFSAFAQVTPSTSSSFERGYQAGRSSCEAEVIKDFWVCKIKNYTTIPNCNILSVSYGSGRSRTEAISRIDAFCLADAAELGVKPTCVQQ